MDRVRGHDAARARAARKERQRPAIVLGKFGVRGVRGARVHRRQIL